MPGARRANPVPALGATLGCLLLTWAAAAQGVQPSAAVAPADEALSLEALARRQHRAAREIEEPTQVGGAPATRNGSISRIDESLREIEELIDDAYFRTALGLVATTRGLLEEHVAQPGLAPRRARLEVLSATAEVALGRSARAGESMRRALAADPRLDLDEENTPPKVLSLLRAARAGAAPASRP